MQSWLGMLATVGMVIHFTIGCGAHHEHGLLRASAPIESAGLTTLPGASNAQDAGHGLACEDCGCRALLVSRVAPPLPCWSMLDIPAALAPSDKTFAAARHDRWDQGPRGSLRRHLELERFLI